MNRRFLLRIFSLLFAVAIAGLSAMPFPGTNDLAPTTGEPPAVASSDAPVAAAMRAHLDPETGEVGVSSAAAPLQLDPTTREALRRDAEGLVQVHHPDGSASMNLQGRFQSVSVARIGKDGKVGICSEDASAVERMLQSSGDVKATPEVK